VRCRQLRERQIVRAPARMTDFGLFVELLPGVDGLLAPDRDPPQARHGDLKQAAETGAECLVLVTTSTRQASYRPRPRARGRPPGRAARVDDRPRWGRHGHGGADRAVRRLPPPRTRPARLDPQCRDGDAPERRPSQRVPARHRGQGRGARRRGRWQAHPPLACQALRAEEEAETKGYLRDSAKQGGGFGMTLGEALRRSRDDRESMRTLLVRLTAGPPALPVAAGVRRARRGAPACRPRARDGHPS